MAIRIINGDLLKSDCDIIMHQANCFKTMGAGIALAIRKIFNEAYQADCKDNRSPEEKLGGFTYAKCERETGDKYIFNLYSQFHYIPRGTIHTNYVALNNALIRAITLISHLERKENRSLKIGLPFGIGCGLAGGDWSNVVTILNKISHSQDIDLFIYKIEN